MRSRLLPVLLAAALVAPAVSPSPARASGGLQTAGQPVSRSGSSNACVGFDDTIVSSAGLRCMELHSTHRAPEARGTVELGRVHSPFGVAVTPDGRQRYRLTLRLEGLPDPAALGAVAYVAWLTTPLLDPVVRLGRVDNGEQEMGEAAFNRFLVLVSAEVEPEASVRSGPLVLRGGSPSTRMHPEDLITQSPMSLMSGIDANIDAGEAHAGHSPESAGWNMPPMHPAVNPVPGMMGLYPDISPWLPQAERPDEVPLARPRELIRLDDGDSYRLEAAFVRREVGSRTFVMLGFNGQIPGPLVHVPHAATVTLRLVNRTPLPLTIHWHGVRLENRFDGVPGLTQEAVPPGGEFDYRVVFPDAGIYWYHPHHREDVAQDMGLYGNLLVDRPEDSPYDRVHREEVLMLDDLLVGDEGLVPYGLESANFVMMGRFGNVFLVNGEPDHRGEARPGEVVRFYLTNVSNTRTFNLTFTRSDGERLPLKVIGTDLGRFERQEWARSVVIAPAERYIVEVLFPGGGEVVLRNEVQGIDHRSGGFFPEVTELGRIRVAGEPALPALGDRFDRLREHPEVEAEVAGLRSWIPREPDLELALRLEVHDLPLMIEQLMALDRAYFNPVEWAGTMPMMNWATSADDLAWHLVEPATGRIDGDIDWRFRTGDLVKVRIINDRHSFHAMQHPIHIHGQRFLVLEQDGVPSENLAWKDTFLAPVGSTTDILLELSNPGRWMIHCHIAEHLSAGMKMVFEVEE